MSSSFHHTHPAVERASSCRSYDMTLHSDLVHEGRLTNKVKVKIQSIFFLRLLCEHSYSVCSCTYFT